MSTREDAAEKPLDPPMLPHETRKDNNDGQTLKEQLAGTEPPGNKVATNPVSEARNTGQYTGTGKPPLMKK